MIQGHFSENIVVDSMRKGEVLYTIFEEKIKNNFESTQDQGDYYKIID